MIVLQTDALRRDFGRLRAVDDLHLHLQRGELLALLGPNGAGKTTLMRMICGVLKPTAGNIQILGRCLEDMSNQKRSKLQRHIGYCPQALCVWHHLTCREQLVLMGQMFDLSRLEADKRASELITTLALDAKADSLGSALSGGMMRRLNIALALVHRPDLLLLDEPAAGLDPQSRVLVREAILRLAHNEGRAVLVSTHDIDEAERIADRVLVMDQGRRIAFDTPRALKACADPNSCGRIELKLPGLPGLAVSHRSLLMQQLSQLSSQITCSNDILVTIAGEASLLEPVQRVLVDQGIKAEEIRFRQRTLEDVFIELTGRRMRG